MRTTLALVLGMGAVLAAAIWTARQVTPETVATTLHEIGIEAEGARVDLEQLATAAAERLEEQVAPHVEDVLEEVRDIANREPLGKEEPVDEEPTPARVAAAVPTPVEKSGTPAANSGTPVAESGTPVVAESRALAPEDLEIETEDFEEATTWDESFEPAPEEPTVGPPADAPPSVAAEDDPEASAARIRRMLSVYRRTVESRP